MVSISDAIAKILSKDFEAKACFFKLTLNLSKYAKQIEPELEKTLFKKLRTQSIVVSLSRLQKNSLLELQNLNVYQKPDLKISQVTSSINLLEFTLEKTQKTNQKIIQWLGEFNLSNQDFFSYIIGQTEITFVSTQAIFDLLQAKKILNPQDCLTIVKDLGSVSIKFENYVLDRPNVVFEILKILAVENTNLVEIISTAQELSLIVNKHDISKLTNKFQEILLR
jgi:aspartokinase